MNKQDSQAPPDHTLDDHTLGASLGFITTLMQHAHNIEHAQPSEGGQPQEQVLAEPQPQENKPKDHEAEQDQEIQSIRAELEQLLTEEQQNGQENQNTGVTE